MRYRSVLVVVVAAVSLAFAPAPAEVVSAAADDAPPPAGVVPPPEEAPPPEVAFDLAQVPAEPFAEFPAERIVEADHDTYSRCERFERRLKLSADRKEVEYGVSVSLRHHLPLRYEVDAGKPVPLERGPGAGRFPSEFTSADGGARLDHHSTAANRPAADPFFGFHRHLFGTTLLTPATAVVGPPLAGALDDRDVMPLALAADGRLAYLAAGRELLVWDTRTDCPVRTLTAIEFKDDVPQTFVVLPSPCGRWVAVFDDNKGQRHLFRGCGLSPAPMPYHGRGVKERVRVWRTADWSEVGGWRNDGGYEYGWTTDGRLTARRWAGQESTDVTVIDPATGSEESRRTEGRPDDGQKCSATSDGGRLTVAWEGGVHGFTLADAHTPGPPRRFNGPRVKCVEFTADGRVLGVWTANGDLRLYDLYAPAKP